jgi:LemA protein
MGTIPMTVTGFVAAGILVYAAMLYNGLIGLRNDIDKAWANIDVLLKQRHDELGRVADVCKEYMHYEQETLLKLTEARAKFATARTVDEKSEASQQVSASATQVFATAERYPDLKANQTFLQLQKRISELENEIADRREFYNDAVNLYNTRQQQMPDALVARLMNLRPRSMFLVRAEEKAPVIPVFSSVQR